MIYRNVELATPLKVSSWRKVAIGTWKTVGDPSVYGVLEIDAAPALAYIEKLKAKSGKRITLTHFIGKAMAMTIERHPEINCILRFGRLYPRKTVDIFFQVASDEKGVDLSGTTIRDINKKSVVQIAEDMQSKVRSIREKGDPEFKKMKNTMGMIPGLLVNKLINFVGFLTYGLNIWSPLLGSPKDPFGSAMITNIGSLGLDMAFAPLVPYSRVPILLAVGTARDTPVVVDGQVVIKPMLRICATFDHRLIDGMHGSLMSRTMQKIFAHPEKELGAI